MRNTVLLVMAMGITSCTSANGTSRPYPTQIYTAGNYVGYSETTHRAELREYLEVDPVRTEWCAAFVNSVLEESGLPTNKDHKYPLTARAFLDWGFVILPDEIQSGDLVVFPRGRQGWQGHVGFYVSTVEINGEDHYAILGGNQNNKVSIEMYPARKALGIRRDYPPF